MSNWVRHQEDKKAIAPVKTIAAGETKYLEFDGGKIGANIHSIAIEGIVGAEWTVKLYVPVEDGVTSPQAEDLRLKEKYIATDVQGGLLSPFAFSHNMFLSFTNDSIASDDVKLVVNYKAAEELILTWEA